MFCEEQILGYKLKSKGYKAVILNSYSFIHNEGGSIGKNIGSKINKYVLHQNSKRVYLKKYLKISRCKLVIFDIVSQLGKLERILLLNIKKVIKFN